jgi:two-component system sensor histidine kinase/response regulator
VVDGNAGRLQALREMLSSWRMETVAADGAGEAVSAFDQAALDGRPLALVILDATISSGSGLELVQSLRGLAGGPAVIVLTSTPEAKEAGQYRELGVRAYLRQPVTPRELMDAITASLASESLERLNAFSNAGRVAEPSRVRRILVAEDNLAHSLAPMLEQRGHTVARASGGREAVDRLTHEKFDVALLDVQMEIDGTEAASAIRALERQGAIAPIFIFAIAASILKGGQERYLAAGANGCIAHPVQPRELFDAVENLSIIQELAPESAFDGALFDNDPEFLTEIVGLFLETYPQLLTEIENAISGQDAAGLRRAAHTLKGAVANFGAKAVVEQAEALETMGKSGDLSSAADGSRALRALLNRFEPELRGALRRAAEQVVM